MRSLLSLVSVTSLACSCTTKAPAWPPLPTESERLTAEAWLADLRRTQPSSPYVAIVQVSLREPHTGHRFAARGAVAVDPHHALRMVLVGPAGATALDVWATPSEWRFEIPPAHILRRGGREADPTFPVGFFRWWFLSPLEGSLVTCGAARAGERFILKDGDAVIDLTDTRTVPRKVTASRSSRGASDRIDFVGASLTPAAGDRAVYDQETTGVHVEVTVESPSDAPDPAAFLDPDSPEGVKARGS
jgi:hypothetical protein